MRRLSSHALLLDLAEIITTRADVEDCILYRSAQASAGKRGAGSALFDVITDEEARAADSSSANPRGQLSLWLFLAAGRMADWKAWRGSSDDFKYPFLLFDQCSPIHTEREPILFHEGLRSEL